MRFSKLFCPTLKETPREAEIVSHKLLLRAGFIQKVAAGIYSFLPLGLRTLRKFETIVREEMNRVDAQEILMPMVIPSTLWEETERWQHYGAELLRLKDRQNNDFCLGPTHEEVVTHIARQHIRSYKALPVTLYQIQTKFRDEIRPRFGLMRGREFGMKDAYSFHHTDEDLNDTYQRMKTAYHTIFKRCGLQHSDVTADSGNIGGDESCEYMVTADTGEDEILKCNGYAANREAAPSCDYTHLPKQHQTAHPIETVETKNKTTIVDVANFLKATPDQCIKAIVINLKDTQIALIILRGDHSLNEAKLKKHLNLSEIVMASDTQIKTYFKADPGYIGPVNPPKNCPIIADHGLDPNASYITGANKTNAHLTHVQLHRDAPNITVADIRFATPGEPCPITPNAPYKATRGIEVGHVFKLGTKYAEKMNATFLDKNGKTQPMIMGCYGIGIGRTIAAAIEQHHDEKGICWPVSLAPYTVVIILADTKKDELVDTATTLYTTLQNANIEVLFDDRKLSAGIKFKDADLIGFPLQIIIGKQWLQNNTFEVIERQSGTKHHVEPTHILQTIHTLLA